MRARDERGATALLMGICLVMLMGFTAIGIDLGISYNHSRNAQAAVDVGALGGAQEIPFGLDEASEKTAALIRDNLELTFTDAEWSAMWAGCTDSQKLETPGEVGGADTDCISFDDTGRMRVRMPTIEADTLFGAAIGVDSMVIDAEATVFTAFSGIGGVLPFTVLGGAEDGTEICLRSSSGGQAVPPCFGADSGNFHALDISIYGNDAFGTDTIDCNTNKNNSFTINVAVGIDHLLRVWDSATGGVTDNCSKPFGPNQFNTFTGLGNGLYNGLIAGETIAGVEFHGRLTDLLDFPGYGTTVDIQQSSTSAGIIDNTPLWAYLPAPADAGFVPATCVSNVVIDSDYEVSTTNLLTCLDDYNAGVDTGLDYDPLFIRDQDLDGVLDIENSRRFAIVPQTFEDELPNGKKKLRIASFKAVWVQGLYFSGFDTDSSQILLPGDPRTSMTVANGVDPLEQVTGFLLPDSTVASVINLGNTAGGEVTGLAQIDLVG